MDEQQSNKKETTAGYSQEQESEHFGGVRQAPPYEPWQSYAPPGYPGMPPFPYFGKRKSKFIAGLLAFFVPGTGHFYLGLMQKGLLLMMLLIMDIISLVYFDSSSFANNVPLIVLFGLLIPVIYFYNIFDALQSADRVNERLAFYPMAEAEQLWHHAPADQAGGGNYIGWMFVLIGGFIILISRPMWIGEIFRITGSYVGAFILIALGVVLFLRNSKKH